MPDIVQKTLQILSAILIRCSVIRQLTIEKKLFFIEKKIFYKWKKYMSILINTAVEK